MRLEGLARLLFPARVLAKLVFDEVVQIWLLLQDVSHLEVKRTTPTEHFKRGLDGPLIILDGLALQHVGQNAGKESPSRLRPIRVAACGNGMRLREMFDTSVARSGHGDTRSSGFQQCDSREPGENRNTFCPMARRAAPTVPQISRFKSRPISEPRHSMAFGRTKPTPLPERVGPLT